MSVEPSNSEWLARNLEATRRRVHQLEIDACRIRTDLARLEVANATGLVMDDEPSVDPLATYIAGTSKNAFDGSATFDYAAEDLKAPIDDDAHDTAELPNQYRPIDTVGESEMSYAATIVGRSRTMYRRATSSAATSIVFHSAALLLMASVTIASLDRASPPPTVLKLGREKSKPTENIDVRQLADLGDTGDGPAININDAKVVAPLGPIEPTDFDSADGAASLGQLGLGASISADVDQYIAGMGGLSNNGAGKPTGLGKGIERGGGSANGVRSSSSRTPRRGESTFFFGTEARGDRFVFIVDNSSSMKGGRLERAVAELVKTINSLAPWQSFYVIFVSDRTYPMFYPSPEADLVPATPANKKRLTEWVVKAILASGKNRELIKAMDMAIALKPQAVYLLWDGDLRYSQDVRLDVMAHLTQPNDDVKYVVHTLGMGVTSLDSEQNLRMIAQAHGGSYRRIDVATGRKR